MPIKSCSISGHIPILDLVLRPAPTTPIHIPNLILDQIFFAHFREFFKYLIEFGLGRLNYGTFEGKDGIRSWFELRCVEIAVGFGALVGGEFGVGFEVWR